MPWARQLADIPLDGIFRRQIDLRAWDGHTVVGWLEDEFHHFGVTLIHDGGHIRDVRVATPRHPWSTCAGAGVPLRALIGQPLTGRCADAAALVDMRSNCTHLLDLASLAAAHAWSGRVQRRYHGTVQPLSDVVDGAARGALRATLRRDGREVLGWDLLGYAITAPATMAGRGILHGFREWTDSLDPADAEDALVLRRVAFVSFGRRVNIQRVAVAADLGQGPVCHTFQPERSASAVRMPVAPRRYDATADAMLEHIDRQPW
jgi:hypothetical protein